jgi:hypothetical protein
MRLFLLFWMFFSVSFAQEAPVIPSSEEEQLVPMDFNEESLAEHRQDSAFDYSEEAQTDNWWTKFKRYLSLQWQRLLNWLFGEYQPTSLLAFFLELLPYLLLAVLGGFILYLFSKLNPAASLLGSSKKADVFLHEEEEIIRFRNIKDLISKALAEGNYRLAIRYHFLYVLQQLSDKGIVKYNAAKTDEDYLAEISAEDLKRAFGKISRIYDFIWYGDFSADAEVYQKVQQDFRRTEALIPATHE